MAANKTAKRFTMENMHPNDKAPTTQPAETPATVVIHETEVDEKFKPKGAIAFFVLLLLICAAIWYSIYYIQLTRQ